ncbi:uncharacterized protein H6S33_009246 [Morchella sextelata]|uniref:uncharacterized protein n=1 Tax=Morchella sextelata TaxID=1174677 RepID=UPI001D05AFAC|nr:uncharacterized protein H6S33_009246 [Morchella sextelata]KAH0612866.1 hypothetical protein H6S33_009246 [Morchella sextelata]
MPACGSFAPQLGISLSLSSSDIDSFFFACAFSLLKPPEQHVLLGRLVLVEQMEDYFDWTDHPVLLYGCSTYDAAKRPMCYVLLFRCSNYAA